MLLLSSFTLPVGRKLSEVIYCFVKLQGEKNISWFGNMQGHGKEYCFYILFLVALIFACVYYFQIAKKVQNATKQNYRGIYIMGYITLVVLSCVCMAIVVTPSAVMTMPMLEISLWNIAWYSLFFEIFSIIGMRMTNQGVHLGNCWK